jgi:IS5 family transposase
MIPFGPCRDGGGSWHIGGSGRESFGSAQGAERQASLDALAALIDWSHGDRVLAPLYPSAKGEKAWPPLAIIKALLLASLDDLSDVMLSEALSDRASFRRFCGFSRDEATPERTAFVRFRRLLVEHGLDRSLFAAIARDLESRAPLCAKARSSMRPSSARQPKATRRRPGSGTAPVPAHGDKAHVAADKDSGIIREVETTAANEPDVSIAPSIIPDAPGEVDAEAHAQRPSLAARQSAQSA